MNEIVNEELCLICQDSTSITSIPSCNHTFCKECLEKYLEQKINDGIVMEIKCPHCTKEIVYDEIVINVNQELMEKYIRFRTQQYADRDPTVRHCPNKLCDRYLPLSSLNCECGQQLCKNCGNGHHGSISCDSILDQLYNLDIRESKIQRCPQCKIVVQKESGCNHMTCKRCQHQFCWICRRKYTSKHYGRYNYLFGCPNKQFSPDLPWKYPKMQQLIPFVLLILLAPLLLILGIILLFIHPLAGGYYLFVRWDQLALRNLNNIQKVLICFFIYILGGIILYPFVVLYELLFIFALITYSIFRLIKRLIL